MHVCQDMLQQESLTIEKLLCLTLQQYIVLYTLQLTQCSHLSETTVIDIFGENSEFNCTIENLGHSFAHRAQYCMSDLGLIANSLLNKSLSFFFPLVSFAGSVKYSKTHGQVYKTDERYCMCKRFSILEYINGSCPFSSFKIARQTPDYERKRIQCSLESQEQAIL